MVEGAVASGLSTYLTERPHLSQHGLLAQCTQYHSVEMALEKVHIRVMRPMDGKGAALLVILDLSAAFDAHPAMETARGVCCWGSRTGLVSVIPGEEV